MPRARLTPGRTGRLLRQESTDVAFVGGGSCPASDPRRRTVAKALAPGGLLKPRKGIFCNPTSGERGRQRSGLRVYATTIDQGVLACTDQPRGTTIRERWSAQM